MNIGAMAAVGQWAPENINTLMSTAQSYAPARVVAVAGTDTPALYQTYRYTPRGDLAYTLPVPPGRYTVRLHWAEMWSPAFAAGVRRFDVWVGDARVDASLDVFSAAGAGRTALVRSYAVTVAEGWGGLDVRLAQVRQSPMLSAVEVVAAPGSDRHGGGAEVSPSPRTAKNSSSGDGDGGWYNVDGDVGGGSDEVPPPVVEAAPPAVPSFPAGHKAHAVIDRLAPHIDRDGNGEERVELTGYGSHTHAFSHTGTPGSLVRVAWFNEETGEHLGDGRSVTWTFLLGSTEVRLEVTDNTGDVSKAYAMVSVTSSLTRGAYCYYYAEPPVFPLPPDVRVGPMPVYAAAVSALDFGAADGGLGFHRGPHFPAGASSATWAARCVFLFNAPTGEYYYFGAESDGAVVAFTGGKTVFSRAAAGAEVEWNGGWVYLSAGLNEMQVQYASGGVAGRRLQVTTGSDAQTLRGALMQHDIDSVVPVVLSVEPSSSGAQGGDTVTVYGAGFYTDQTQVYFGGVEATYVTRVGPAQLTAVVPPAVDEATGEVRLSVTTGADSATAEGGSSNGVPFYYAADTASIRYTTDTLKTEDGSAPFALPSGIAVVIGPDGRYYVGLYGAKVLVLTIDADHRVKDQCTSGSLGEGVSVAGLAFNPADGPDVKLYAATSALHYVTRLGWPLSAWDRGKVLLLEPNAECLGVTKEVITGLPISNHDHATAGLSFDQRAILRFITGGQSNMGTNINSELSGGLAETPLSAAMIVADVHKPGFDGAVTYSQTTNETTADQTGGWDVRVYAAGIRSGFGAVQHTNGHLYATDNGPNRFYGDASETCTAVKESGTHGDKLLLVREGAYYGHANRNRARTDARQCRLHWPGAPGSDTYTPPLLSFATGSYNGIVEVLSNLFPAVKHDLFITRFSGGAGGLAGETKRIRLSDGGTRATFVGDVASASGVDVTETPHGSYLMPRVQKGQMLVVAPVRPPHLDASRPYFVAVKPHRGRAAGGNVVTVGGLFFGDAPTATFGGRPCTDVHAVADDGRSFRCTVPAAEVAGTLVRVVVATAAGVESVSSAGRGDFWYMDV